VLDIGLIFQAGRSQIGKGKIMRILHVLIVAALLFLLASCQSIREGRISEDFTKGEKEYIRMVRWQEMGSTPLYFVNDPLREEFKKRVEDAKDVKIADYRIKYRDFRPGEGKADVTVEWDYYIPPSITLKTVEDAQKWQYFDTDKKKGWVLMSLFPEFK
jgi:hypothetical protein